MSNSLDKNAEKEKLQKDPGKELFDELVRITTDRFFSGHIEDEDKEKWNDLLQTAVHSKMLYDLNGNRLKSVQADTLENRDLFFVGKRGDVRLLKKDGISVQPLSVKEFTEMSMPAQKPVLDPPLSIGEKIGNFFLRLVTFGARGIGKVEKHERAVAKWEKDKQVLAYKMGYPTKSWSASVQKKVKETFNADRQEKSEKLSDDLRQVNYNWRWFTIAMGDLQSRKYSELLDNLSALEPMDKKIVFERAITDEQRAYDEERDMAALAQQVEKFEEDPEAYRKAYEKATGKVIPSLEDRRLVNELKARVDDIVYAEPKSNELQTGYGFVKGMLDDALYKTRDMDSLKEFSKLTNQQISDMCKSIVPVLEKRNHEKKFTPFILADYVAAAKQNIPQQPGQGGGAKKGVPVKDNLAKK